MKDIIIIAIKVIAINILAALGFIAFAIGYFISYSWKAIIPLIAFGIILKGIMMILDSDDKEVETPGIEK